MVLFAGGNSAVAGGNPNPPPPKSSSTLSPLAPPFTVNPNPNLADPGFSNLNAGIASPSLDYRLALSPQVGVSEGFRAYGNDSNFWQGEQVNSSVRKLHYGSPLECTNWLQDEVPKFVTDDYFSGLYNISEGSVGVPSSTLECTPVTHLSDPVSTKASCNALVADTTYNLSMEDTYNGSDTLVRAPSSLHKGMLYSSALDPISSKFSNTFDSKSSYDRYIQQLDCSTRDPMTYFYPATTYSNSFQFSSPSTCGTNSYMNISMLEDKTFPFGDLYNANADYAAPLMLKETTWNQNLEAKEDNDESSRTHNMQKCSGIPVESFVVSHEGNSKKSMIIPVEVNSGLATNYLDRSNTFIPGFSSTIPADESIKDSSFSLDQTVDSPCWKGASMSQQSPFTSLEPAFVHSIQVESEGHNDMEKCRKHLPVSAGCSFKESSSVAIFPNIEQICRDICKMNLDNEKEIRHSAVCNGQNFDVRSDKERIDEKDNKVTLLNQKNVTSSNRPILESCINNHEAGYNCVLQDSSSKCPHPTTDAAARNIIEQLGSSLLMVKDAQLSVVLEALGDISEMFLAFDVGELKDRDHELLQLVIQNLITFSMKNRKDFCKGSSKASEPEVAHSKHTGLEGSSAMKQCNINISHDTKGNMHSVGCARKNNELDNMTSDCGASCINQDQDVVQAFQKILEKNDCEQGQDLQASVYKKLWIDAEAALCSMKYELQLALMKSETENHKKQTEGKIADIFVGNSQSLISRPNNLMPILKEQDVAPSFVARRDVLKNHDDGSNSMIAELQEVDPSLIARLSVLKGQGDRASSVTAEEVDPSFIARLNVLKGRDDRANSVTAEEVDPSFISRLNVLKGRDRDDRLSTMTTEVQQKVTSRAFKANQNPLTTMDKEEVDPFVLARLNILKGRDDKPSSMNADISSVFGSAAVRNSSTPSASGLQQYTSNPSTPSGLALQQVASNHNTPSGAGLKQYTSNWQEKQILAGSQGYSSSSSDWEHVIMEEL